MKLSIAFSVIRYIVLGHEQNQKGDSPLCCVSHAISNGEKHIQVRGGLLWRPVRFTLLPNRLRKVAFDRRNIEYTFDWLGASIR